MRSCLIGWILLVPAVLWVYNPAQASPSCENMFKNNEFLAAARCFQTQANLMPPTAQLSKIQRYLKGQILQNTALAFQKAADLEQNAEIAAFRREQAVSVLRQYLDKNLCQKKYLCQQAKGNILELLNKIKYTPFSVVTVPGKQAVIKVEGYQFKVRHIAPPTWNQTVRPGRYTVEVLYEGQRPLRQDVIIVPGQSRTITVLGNLNTSSNTSGTSSQGRSIVPWIVLGLGVAIAGVGGALLGVGVGKTAERDSVALNIANEASNKTPAERLTMAAAPQTSTQIKQMDDAHNTAATLLPTGWVMAGVGAATALTGVVLFFVLRPKSTGAQAQTPSSLGSLQSPSVALFQE